MLGRLGRDAGSLIGVEISSSAVRVAQVGPGSQVGWAVEPLAPGAWSDPRNAMREEVAQALKRALTRSGARGRRAAVGLPATFIIERHLLLPTGLSDVQIDAQLRAELEASVPFDLEDAALDYQVLGPCDEDPGFVQVACILCQQEDLEPLVAVLELGGLQPCRVEPDRFALERAGDALPLPDESMAIAHGLALAGRGEHPVNLLPWRQWRVEHRARRFNVLLGGMALLAAFATVLADSWLRWEIALHDQANAQLHQQLADLDGQLEGLAVLHDRQQALRGQLERHAGLQARQHWHAQLLERLMSAVPPGIQLTGLTVEGGLLTLSGVAQGAADVPAMLRQLERLIDLRGAALKEIKATAQGEQFRLQGVLPVFAGEVAS